LCYTEAFLLPPPKNCRPLDDGSIHVGYIRIYGWGRGGRVGSGRVGRVNISPVFSPCPSAQPLQPFPSSWVVQGGAWWCWGWHCLEHGAGGEHETPAAEGALLRPAAFGRCWVRGTWAHLASSGLHTCLTCNSQLLADVALVGRGRWTLLAGGRWLCSREG
jgi:hypothetical protein